MATQVPPKRQPPPTATSPLPGGAAFAGATAAGVTLAAALIPLFAGSLTGLALMRAVRNVLLGIGVGIIIAEFLSFAYVPLPEDTLDEVGPAEENQRELAAVYRAWYIVNALARLTRAEKRGALAKAETRETRFFHLHNHALRARSAAAHHVDLQAERYGNVLGWKAVMDVRTTLECRDADGKNFRADAEPLIGWPGSVHPHCRCFPVQPFPGAPLLPSV